MHVWVQLKKEKWLPISRKRHQIGQLGFRSFRLLTDRLQVQILPGEPTSDFSVIWMSREHSALCRIVCNKSAQPGSLESQRIIWFYLLWKQSTQPGNLELLLV